jgi:hydrogenase maturation factor
LAAVAPERAAGLVAALRDAGFDAAQIGHVTDPPQIRFA